MGEFLDARNSYLDIVDRRPFYPESLTYHSRSGIRLEIKRASKIEFQNHNYRYDNCLNDFSLPNRPAQNWLATRLISLRSKASINNIVKAQKIWSLSPIQPKLKNSFGQIINNIVGNSNHTPFDKFKNLFIINTLLLCYSDLLIESKTRKQVNHFTTE
jgi:hypothetical protein